MRWSLIASSVVAAWGASLVLGAGAAPAAASSSSLPTSFTSRDLTFVETGEGLMCYPIHNGVCASSTGPGEGWFEKVTQVNDTFDFREVKLQQQKRNTSEYMGAWPGTITGTEHHERIYMDKEGASHVCQWTATLSADPTQPAVGTLRLEPNAKPPSASFFLGLGAKVTTEIEAGSDCGTYDGFHIGPETTELDFLSASGAYDPSTQTVTLNTASCLHTPTSIAGSGASWGGECAESGKLVGPTPEIFDVHLEKKVTDETEHVLTGTGITVSAQGVSTWTNPQWKIDGSSTPPESTAVKDYRLEAVAPPAGIHPVDLGESDLQGLSVHFFLVAPGAHQVSFTGTDPATGVLQTISTTYEVQAPAPQASPQACTYFSVALSSTEGYIMVLTQSPDPPHPVYLITPFGLPGAACSPIAPYDYEVDWSLANMPEADAGYPSSGELQISQLINRNAAQTYYGVTHPVYEMARGVFELDSGPFFQHLVGGAEQSGPVQAPGPITSFDRPSLTLLPQAAAPHSTKEVFQSLSYGMLADAAAHGSASDQVDLRTYLEFKAGGSRADSVWVSLGYVELAYQGTERKLVMPTTGRTLRLLQPTVSLLTAPATLSNIDSSQPAVSGATQSSSSWSEGSHQGHAHASAARVGTTFAISLNQPTDVTLVFAHPQRGRALGRRCVALTRHNRRKRACVQSNPVGTITFAGHPGANRLHFQGRLPSGRWLKPGRYTVLIFAATAGNISGRILTFTILKR